MTMKTVDYDFGEDAMYYFLFKSDGKYTISQEIFDLIMEKRPQTLKKPLAVHRENFNKEFGNEKKKP